MFMHLKELRLAFSFTDSNNFNSLLLLKSFITKVLEYKAVLKFKKLYVLLRIS